MAQNMMQIILNPVRMRIVQHLLLHDTATVSDIAAALPDVPKASLYRHINKLTGCGAVQIESVKRVRGTLQRTYRLASQIPGMDTGREITNTIYTLLIMLAGDFERYHLQHPEPDEMVKDMLFANQSVLMLSDQEFEEFLNDIGALFNKALEKPYCEGRKPRKLSVICSPCLPEHDANDKEDC